MLDSTTDLKGMLSDPGLLETRAYLAGAWTDGADGKTFDVTNPARGDVIAQVADVSRSQIALSASEPGLIAWRPSRTR